MGADAALAQACPVLLLASSGRALHKPCFAKCSHLRPETAPTPGLSQMPTCLTCSAAAWSPTACSRSGARTRWEGGGASGGPKATSMRGSRGAPASHAVRRRPTLPLCLHLPLPLQLVEATRSLLWEAFRDPLNQRWAGFPLSSVCMHAASR